jgi:RNA polymerase sigma factor for flagellar operon FliA
VGAEGGKVPVDDRPVGLAVDEEAIVGQHLALVGYVVNDVLTRVPAHVERDDLVAAGLMALVQAARAFDPAVGVPFSGYARVRIRGAVLDELRAADWAPRGVRSRARAVSSAEEELTARLGRSPTPAEVAALLGTSPDDVTTARADLTRAVLSLEAFDGVLDEQLADSQLSPEDRLLHEERVAVLRAALEALPERLRLVVTGVFFEDRPMAEIAARLGVTESRVSQLRAEAMALLRDGVNSRLSPELVSKPERPGGVVARRRQAYYAEVAARAAYGAVTARQPARVARVTA